MKPELGHELTAKCDEAGLAAVAGTGQGYIDKPWAAPLLTWEHENAIREDDRLL
jgi:hypothetical protein